MKRTIIYMRSRTERHMLSGSVFRIDQRLERRADRIFLDRSYIRHPEIAAVRSVLLPAQHLWILFFEGHDRPYPFRCYMHIARILDEGDTITVEDLYLDVIIKQDGRWHLVDVDEFRAAVAAGELTPAQMDAALQGLENACRLVDQCGVDLEGYLHRSMEGV